MMGSKQNLWRKRLQGNLNRVHSVLANAISLLIKLFQFRIPEFLTGGDALQIFELRSNN